VRLFPFIKRITTPLQLEVDVHSHLLPGVDDGVENLGKSIAILKGLWESGWKKVVLTPHQMEGFFVSDVEKLEKIKKELEEELKKEGILLQLELGGEYYTEPEIVEKIENREEKLLTIGGKYLLFEFPLGFISPLVERMVSAIKNRGLTPILAHPERYPYLTPTDYQELKEMGVLFQSTIGSFGGRYGKNVKKRALHLAKEKMVDFLGSDIHNWQDFRFTQHLLTSHSFTYLLSKNPLKNQSLL